MILHVAYVPGLIRRLFPAAVLWVALLLAGCGGSQSDQVFGVAGPPAYNGFVLGRVMLEEPMSEGRVVLETLQGETIRQLSTDKLGFFHFRGQLPADFSVLATPTGTSDTYRLEVRGGWRGGTLYVNCATTLAAAYAAAHPELTYPVAGGRVHQYLGLQRDYWLAWVSSVRTERYDPTTFYDGVRQMGLNPYLQTQIEAIDAPPLALGLSSIVTSLGSAVGSTLLQDVINASAGGAIGAGLNKMNMNFGTSAELDEIIDMLSEISSEIMQLGDSLSKDTAYLALSVTQTAAYQYVTQISDLTNNIKTVCTGYKTTHPSDDEYNIPQAVPDSVATVIGSVTTFAVNDAAESVADYLLGRNGAPSVVKDYIAEQMAELLISGTDYGGYPVRTNALTAGQSNVAGFYINALAQASNLEAEIAHLKSPAAVPLFDAAKAVDEIQQDIQQARWLVPDPLCSDDVLLDMENSVMWYLAFQSSSTYSDAADWAANYSVGPYDDWVLPVESQLETLVTSRLLGLAGLSGSSWSNVDASVWKAAFQSLGFDTTYYPGNDTNQGSWFDVSTSTDFSGVFDPTDLYVWNGSVFANPSTLSADQLDGSANYVTPFLLMRSFPGDPENAERGTSDDPTLQFVDELENLDSGGELYASPFSGAIFVNNLYLSAGTPTSFDPLVPSNPNQLRAFQGFQGFTGGNFFDVTTRCTFTSDQPRVASVSNAVPSNDPRPTAPNPDAPPPGPIGRITWHPSLTGEPLPPVTFTASLGGLISASEVGVHTRTVTVNPPAGLQPEFSSLQILPVNQQYNLESDPNPVITCTATAFYKDGQFVEVSTDTDMTWMAFDANGVLLNSQATGGFGVLPGSSKNQLFLTGNIPTTNITIQGTYDGPWGGATTTAKASLILP